MHSAPQIAVLGCGSIGSRHLRNLCDLGYTGLMAFDPDPQIRQKVSEELGVGVSGSLDDIWHWRPAVALVTAPTNLHVELALMAARQNCHLFIEKPLSHSLDGVDGLCAEVEDRGLTTLVGCNMRFHPGPVRLKKWLGERAVGQVLSARFQTGSYLPRWRPGQDYHQSYSASPVWGGAVLDCIHELDLALWLLGGAKVLAAVTRPAISIGLKTDGLAEVILEHESGVISNLHLNFIQRNYRRAIEIIGSEGSIEWEFNCGQAKRYGPDGNVEDRVDQAQDWEMNRMYVDELRYFLRCVQEGLPSFNPIQQAAETLKVALQARAGKWQR